MSSIININFNNATITENQLWINVKAANFVMSESANFTFAGAGFDPLPNGILGINVYPDGIAIVAQMGSGFSAAISVGVAPVTIPTITGSGYEGSVDVTWWDNSGQQTQPLTAGEPLVLEGFAG
ncbi:hypothetical protein G6M50_26940 [Agrobacterium rhizogenes]|jgi:hypothetical protein|uniref:Uncharacterized protein n=2 Tax=unclassified Rhizobium TaxID=2613769 RepID=A0AAU7SCP6_9HYPH|nr:hypothetical protein [Rhizobium rhizogenes]NTJ81428.1 hypothetical protein [Rhizobium rhizogenes]